MNTKNIFLLFFSLILFSCGSDDDAPEDNVINILDYVEDAAFKDYLIKDVFNGKTFATRSDASKVTIIEYADSNNETKSLKGLEFFTNLDSLFLYNTSISSLDLSYNIKLKKLDFSYNKTLKTINLSKNTELTSFVSVITSLSSLDFSENTKLTSFLCVSTNFSSLNFTKCSKLGSLDINDKSISALDLSQNKELKILILEIPYQPKSIKVSKSIINNQVILFPKSDYKIYDWVD